MRPKQPPTLTGRPVRTIFHHTAGHARPIGGNGADERAAAIDYARRLQLDMMDRRGWDDSGHNFLVMRSGLILQGRWGTVSAIEHGRMVISAHCPGQNDQPGVEHEHVDGETLTTLQQTATVWLHAWIMDRCGIRPTEIYPHGFYYPTACPGTLDALVPYVRLLVAGKLTAAPAAPPRKAGLLTRARFTAGSAKLV